ncbi:MAG: hypothetical protein NT121_03515 [Chloroflexi bacterium]|nr:hypothetical protein [Chloroflexota bacterium]
MEPTSTKRKTQATKRKILSGGALKTEIAPIGTGRHRTNQPHKDNKQNHATTAPAATAAPKTKLPLRPIKNTIDQKKLKQARKTSRTVIHAILLQMSNC